MTDLVGWYPVSLADGIEPATSTGIRVEGREFVVWRDSKGAVHVWEDRCPHRGMKLSFGFVRGDHIACLYHGWQYDAGGQCRYIPAHPDLKVPETIRVPAYAVAIAGGMIWARFDLSSAEPPRLVEAVPVRSVYVDASKAVLREELLRRGATAVTDRYVTLWLDDSAVGVGLQPIDEGRSALHMTVDVSSARHAVALWGETIRNELEGSLALARGAAA